MIGHLNRLALYAADSLQLVAVILVCGNNSDGVSFVSFDDRLNIAAQREGFTTLG